MTTRKLKYARKNWKEAGQKSPRPAVVIQEGKKSFSGGGDEGEESSVHGHKFHYLWKIISIKVFNDVSWANTYSLGSRDKSKKRTTKKKTSFSFLFLPPRRFGSHEKIPQITTLQIFFFNTNAGIRLFFFLASKRTKLHTKVLQKKKKKCLHDPTSALIPQVKTSCLWRSQKPQLKCDEA
jgi:hypothetical protein